MRSFGAPLVWPGGASAEYFDRILFVVCTVGGAQAVRREKTYKV